MNVEEGLGTKNVMITFITSSISSLVLVPYMIDFLGAKAAIIIGEIGFLVYIAANFYPSWYTLIPASIFHGLTESAPWAGSSVYVTFLGERQWLHRRNRSNVLKSKEFYIYKFFCQFAGMIIFADMFGSGIVSLFLLAFQNIDNQTNTRKNHTISSIDSLNNSTSTNGYIMAASSETTNLIKIAECGSNDCPGNYAYNGTEEKLAKFIPNPLSTYLLIGVFVVISLAAMAIQMLYLPRVPAKFDKLEHDSNREMKGIMDVEYEERNIEAISKCKNMRKELKHIFFFIISPLNLLVMMLFFYYGMYFGYLITDFTRAFISCVIGVEQLGIVVTVQAVSGIVASAVNTKIIP